VLAEATAKAAIHKDGLHPVEQFVAQGQRIPGLGGSRAIVTTGRHYAAGQQIYPRVHDGRQERWHVLCRAPTERLAGTLFKYHNYIETYDGWRPPLHDPWVNVSLWLRGGQQFEKAGVREVNPLLVADQVGLYHRLFPHLPLKAACVCAYTHDGLQYQQWVPAKPKPNEP